MSRPRPHHRDRAAERRGILATAMVRAIAAAELHRDRARSRLAAVERQVAVDRAMGHDMHEAEAGLVDLRRSLAAAETRLDAAREAFA